MEILLGFDNGTVNGAAKWKSLGVGNFQGVTKCSLCAADPWVPAERKTHDYGRTAKLKEHLRTRYHCGQEAFFRRMNVLSQESKDKRFVCPYGCGCSHKQMSHLSAHVRESSTSLKYGQDHENRKTEDGWYEPDWNPEQLPESVAVALAGSRKRKAEKESIDNATAVAVAANARINAELAATLPYANHRIERHEREVVFRGQRNVLYFSGHEQVYEESGRLHYGEEEDSAITTGMATAFAWESKPGEGLLM